MQILLILIWIICHFHQTLYWVWFWQIKEYRRDRFLAGISKKNFLDQYNLRYWPRPKLTARVVITLLVAQLFIGVNFLLAPLTIALAVGIVTPIFILYKKYLIKKATGKFKGLVIGITGSYGKSSTKELLAHILSTKYKVAKTSKNINSEIGVAQTVLKLKGDEEIFVVEMGAYKRGEIKAICDIVKPKIGIITGIGDQHLELFGSKENLKKTKYELVDAVEKSFIAEKVFSLAEAKNLKQNIDSIEFDYEKNHFKIPVLGRELARNVIGVIKVAKYLGVDKINFENFDSNQIYPKLIKIGKDAYIVDNTYNASFEAFLSSLEYLKVFEGFYKIVVTSGLIELGPNAEKDLEIIKQKANFVDEFIIAKSYKISPREKTVYLFMGRVRYD